MRRRARWLLLISLVGTGPMAAADPDRPPLTFADAYALALKRSETIAIQGELIKETEGRFLQALSGALPRASFELSEKRQDGTGASAFTLNKIPERKFVFSQPLFSGFKEFAAMAATRAERRQRTHEKARAEQLLLVDVADAFYLLRQQREDLSALEVTRAALLERLEELEARERLGRSRPSERVSAEAQLHRVLADIEAARSQEAVARHLMEFLIGRDPVEGVADADPLPPALQEEAAYFARAATRADVAAAEEALRAAQKQVTVTRADIWPDVDLEGNYYTKRAGVSADIDWDVLLKVNVPIFQGGQTAGAIREASAQARRAHLTLTQTQRAAVRDVQDAYAKARLARDRTAALEQALAAAEENYRLQQDDYRLSLVSNLDVLQALQELQDARRDLIQARADARRLYYQLRAATGQTL